MVEQTINLNIILQWFIFVFIYLIVTLHYYDAYWKASGSQI